MEDTIQLEYKHGWWDFLRKEPFYSLYVFSLAFLRRYFDFAIYLLIILKLIEFTEYKNTTFLQIVYYLAVLMALVKSIEALKSASISKAFFLKLGLKIPLYINYKLSYSLNGSNLDLVVEFIKRFYDSLPDSSCNNNLEHMVVIEQPYYPLKLANISVYLVDRVVNTYYSNPFGNIAHQEKNSNQNFITLKLKFLFISNKIT